jgi:hypothetical protein
MINATCHSVPPVMNDGVLEEGTGGYYNGIRDYGIPEINAAELS